MKNNEGANNNYEIQIYRHCLQFDVVAIQSRLRIYMERVRDEATVLCDDVMQLDSG